MPYENVKQVCKSISSTNGTKLIFPNPDGSDKFSLEITKPFNTLVFDGIDFNALNSQDIASIIRLMQANSALERLKFNKCNFGDYTLIQSLLAGMVQAGKIKELEISETQETSNLTNRLHIDLIANHLKELVTLTNLSLAHNNLDGNSGNALCEIVPHLTQLTNLNLSYNQFSDEAQLGRKLGETIGKCAYQHKLHSLIMSECGFKKAALKAFFSFGPDAHSKPKVNLRLVEFKGEISTLAWVDALQEFKKARHSIGEIHFTPSIGIIPLRDDLFPLIPKLNITKLVIEGIDLNNYFNKNDIIKPHNEFLVESQVRGQEQEIIFPNAPTLNVNLGKSNLQNLQVEIPTGFFLQIPDFVKFEDSNIAFTNTVFTMAQNQQPVISSKQMSDSVNNNNANNIDKSGYVNCTGFMPPAKNVADSMDIEKTVAQKSFDITKLDDESYSIAFYGSDNTLRFKSTVYKSIGTFELIGFNSSFDAEDIDNIIRFFNVKANASRITGLRFLRTEIDDGVILSTLLRKIISLTPAHIKTIAINDTMDSLVLDVIEEALASIFYQSNCYLEELDLSDNKLSNSVKDLSSLSRICKAGNEKLQKLNLSNILFAEHESQIAFSVIGQIANQCQSLHTLNIDNTGLTGKAIEVFAEQLKSKKFKQISMVGNKISVINMYYVFSVMLGTTANINSIDELHISVNVNSASAQKDLINLSELIKQIKIPCGKILFYNFQPSDVNDAFISKLTGFAKLNEKINEIYLMGTPVFKRSQLANKEENISIPRHFYLVAPPAPDQDYTEMDYAPATASPNIIKRRESNYYEVPVDIDTTIAVFLNQERIVFKAILTANKEFKMEGIDFTVLQPDDVENIVIHIQKLANQGLIKSISLIQAKIGDYSQFNFFLKEINKSKSITKLAINYTVDSLSLRSIKDTLTQLQNLESLSLAHNVMDNQTGKEDYKTIIDQCPRLAHLDLSFINFDRQAITVLALGESIAKKPSLQSLDLSGVRMDSTELKSFAFGFSQGSNVLKQLRFVHKKLDSNLLHTFIRTIQESNPVGKVGELHISVANYTPAKLTALLEEFKQVKFLKKLVIHDFNDSPISTFRTQMMQLQESNTFIDEIEIFDKNTSEKSEAEIALAKPELAENTAVAMQIESPGKMASVESSGLTQKMASTGLVAEAMSPKIFDIIKLDDEKYSVAFYGKNNTVKFSSTIYKSTGTFELVGFNRNFDKQDIDNIINFLAHDENASCVTGLRFLESEISDGVIFSTLLRETANLKSVMIKAIAINKTKSCQVKGSSYEDQISIGLIEEALKHHFSFYSIHRCLEELDLSNNRLHDSENDLSSLNRICTSGSDKLLKLNLSNIPAESPRAFVLIAQAISKALSLHSFNINNTGLADQKALEFFVNQLRYKGFKQIFIVGNKISIANMNKYIFNTMLGGAGISRLYNVDELHISINVDQANAQTELLALANAIANIKTPCNKIVFYDCPREHEEKLLSYLNTYCKNIKFEIVDEQSIQAAENNNNLSQIAIPATRSEPQAEIYNPYVNLPQKRSSEIAVQPAASTGLTEKLARLSGSAEEMPVKAVIAPPVKPSQPNINPSPEEAVNNNNNSNLSTGLTHVIDKLSLPENDKELNETVPTVEEHTVAYNKLIKSLENRIDFREVDYNRLQGFEKIGEGSFSVVYKAYHDNMQYALKEFKQLSGQTPEETIKAGMREVIALYNCAHENVARLVGISFGENAFYMVMIYYATTLQKMIEDDVIKNINDWSFLMQITHELLAGLNHIHTIGKTAHRDIKLSNIFFDVRPDKDGKTQYCLKIADLGVAKADDIKGTFKGQTTIVGSLVGTFDYLPPETWIANIKADKPLLNIPSELITPTQKHDIYSFGIVMSAVIKNTVELVSSTGDTPEMIARKNATNYVRSLMTTTAKKSSATAKFKPQSPVEFDESFAEERPELLTFIGSCLSFFPSARHTAAEALYDLDNKVIPAINVKPLPRPFDSIEDEAVIDVENSDEEVIDIENLDLDNRSFHGQGGVDKTIKRNHM